MARNEEELIVMPYSSYQLCQVQRAKNDAEIRRADTELGMRAVAASQLWGRVSRPVRGYPEHHRAARHPESGAAVCEAGIACLTARS